MNPIDDVDARSFVEQERANLDAKINELEMALSRLKKRRNTLTPISKIPSEVLFQIFKCVTGHNDKIRLLYADYNGIQKENHLEMAWIRAITHVCSAWRDLALDTPSLWNRISLNSKPDIIFAMLGRSQTMPLTISLVDLSQSYNPLNAVMDQPKHLQRIKHLELGFHFYAGEGMLTKFEAHPPPGLESFSLSGMLISPSRFPFKLIQNYTDTLRVLQVTRCTSDGHKSEVLSLPNLSEFVLHGSAHDIFPLFTQFSFQPTCFVEIYTWDEIQETHIVQLEQTIHRIWNTVNERTWTLHVERENDIPQFRITMQNTKNTGDNLIIRESYVESLYRWTSFSAFAYVQTLEINLGLGLDVRTLLAQLCPNIIALSLIHAFSFHEDNLVWWLRDVLYRRDPSGASPSSPTPSPVQGLDALRNPNLEKLTLSGYSLHPELYNALLDCVKQRHELGISIKVLTLLEFKVDSLDDLVPYVGEIVYRPDCGKE